MNDDGVMLHHGMGLAMQVDALMGVGQFERARQLALDALAQRPDDPTPHLMLGLVNYRLGEHEAALGSLDEALRRDPTSDHALQVRAGCLFSLARFQEAEESIRRAMSIDPAYAPHHALYAHILSFCDEDEAALRHCEQALALDPEDASLHTLRAQLLLQVHPSKWSLSEEAVRQALRINPEDASSHAILGMTAFRAGRYAEAEASFRTALSLQPAHPLALRGLSEMVKGQSLIYRPMLAYQSMMSRLGPDGQLGVLFALWAFYSATSSVLPAEPAWMGDGLFALYMGFALYTWFSESITVALLRRRYPWLQ